jgi:hypothetical protein
VKIREGSRKFWTVGSPDFSEIGWGFAVFAHFAVKYLGKPISHIVA